MITESVESRCKDLVRRGIQFNWQTATLSALHLDRNGSWDVGLVFGTEVEGNGTCGFRIGCWGMELVASESDVGEWNLWLRIRILGNGCRNQDLGCEPAAWGLVSRSPGL